ncbi:MAG: TonB-dependent receptor [Acidobacteriia bacterium]|nr:TonB-dependent receptor [Terriglobia bacterium]
MKSLHRNVLASVCLLFALFAIAVAPVSAQVQNGIFTGTVMDPQGAAVASADVTITNLGTNYTVTAKTNVDGVFRVPELPVGSYKILVSATGFKKQMKSGLYLGAGVIERVDFKLEIGAQAETVTVEAGAVMVQTEDTRLYETIGSKQVANLPLNGRNVFDLITLAPGAVDATGVSFENGHSTVVNGLRPNFNGFMINGSSDKGLSGGAVTTPNADMVQEFQELTLNMSAQYGNSAAAIVNVVTKSGTNELHGSAYEFLRNDKFDANDFFRNASTDPAVNGQPEKLRYNQFGVTATGPIWKDHLFFTASYQGDRFITAAAPVPITTESPEWRQAVISGLPNSAAALIYGNFPTASAGSVSSINCAATSLPVAATLDNYINCGNATNASGWGGSSFAAMMCPDNYPTGFGGIATQFQAIFGVLASDSFAGCSVTPALRAGSTARTIPFLNDNLVLFGSQAIGNLFNGNEWSSRIDWLRKNDRVFGEYQWVHTSDSYGPPNAGSNIHGFRNPTANHFPNMQVSWVHTFSPNWVNEARAGYSLNRTDTNVGTPGVPAIGFDDGSAGFGSYSGYPQFFHENIYSYGDMMSFQKGKHSIKVGVDFRRNIENSEFNIARPSYYFFDQLFFAADAPYGMSAGVDPGFVSNQPAQLADNYRHWRNLEVGAYIQDDWKVSRKLTVNIGLRYDLFTRHTEKMGKVTTFLPGPGCTVPANGYCADWIFNANIPAGDPGCDTATQLAKNVLAGVCGPGGFAVADSLGAGNHKNFGPRAGFSYDPWGNGKTAIRGGFGLSYEGTLYNPLSNSRWNPPFYSFNGVNNALVGDVNAIVYGPTATVGGVADCSVVTTACTPSGVAPTFTGPPANPGIGTGTQATGNIQGYNSWNSNFANLTGIVFPAGLRDPMILNYYFGFQREILPKTTIEINYVGTQGHHLFRAEQANRLPGDRLGLGVQVVDQFGRTLTGLGHRYLNPNYGRLRVWDNVSKSWYSGLQVAVRHQVTRGFAFNLNYAWSHSIDTGSDWHSGATSANGSAAGDGYSLDPTMPMLDKGNSTFDIRHRLSFNYVYEVPFYKDQKGLIGHVLGGWQYQAIWAMQSGAHFTPYCATGSRCDFNYDGERNDRPDVLVGSSYSPTHDQWANGWFAGTSMTAWCGGGPGSCSASTSFFQTPCRACDGNLGRNTFVGPGLFNTDQSLFKNIRITERFNMQFRFEVFNALNHVNFKLPSSSTGANFANRITSGNFGQSAGEMSPRLMQFALKLLW